MGARTCFGRGRSAARIVRGDIAARISVGWIGAGFARGFHLVSLYLITGGKLCEANLDILQELAAILDALDGPWLAGADWQVEPAVLEAAGWPELVGGRICAPNVATCVMGASRTIIVCSLSRCASSLRCLV